MQLVFVSSVSICSSRMIIDMNYCRHCRSIPLPIIHSFLACVGGGCGDVVVLVTAVSTMMPMRLVMLFLLAFLLLFRLLFRPFIAGIVAAHVRVAIARLFS